ncbi:MAG: phospholipid carrier-dependent glycosyltransferase [Myxococcales bacterium]|nr:phospholipid carrier-dependent glycosyltransferase [Myxococcales bacterium]
MEPTTVSRAKHRLVMASLLLLAAWLRLRAIDFGLPYPFAAIDEHIVTDHAIGFTTGDLNPHYFAYPSGCFLLHSIAYLGAFLFGPHESLAEFRDAFWVAPQSLLLLSRWLTALLAIATVWAVSRLAAELARTAGFCAARRPAAWFAAAALASSHLHAANSRWTTVDVPMLLAATIGLVLALRHLRRGGRGTAAGAAIAIGLAASCKYYGALFAIGVGVAVAWRAWVDSATAISSSALQGRRHRARLVAVALARAAGWTIVAFVATSPFVVLDFAAFENDFAELSRHMEGGHFGHDPTRSGAAVYAAHLVGPWIGAWLVVPAALGALLAATRRGARIALLVIVLPAAVHFMVIARFKAQPVDYLLGLLPALVAVAGLFAAALVRRVATSRAPRTAFAALALLAAPLAFGVQHALDFTSYVAREDSRVAARRWIEEHLPPGTLVAADTWLDLELTTACLEQMRDARARELLQPPGAPPEIPKRRARDEPLAALDAKLAAARLRPSGRGFDFGFLSPQVEIGLRDELFAVIRENGGRWLILDGSRAARAQRTGGDQLDLAAWYRRHMSGPMVVARFDPAGGTISGPALVVLDLRLDPALAPK